MSVKFEFDSDINKTTHSVVPKVQSNIPEDKVVKDKHAAVALNDIESKNEIQDKCNERLQGNTILGTKNAASPVIFKFVKSHDIPKVSVCNDNDVHTDMIKSDKGVHPSIDAASALGNKDSLNESTMLFSDLSIDADEINLDSEDVVPDKNDKCCVTTAKTNCKPADVSGTDIVVSKVGLVSRKKVQRVKKTSCIGMRVSLICAVALAAVSLFMLLSWNMDNDNVKSILVKYNTPQRTSIDVTNGVSGTSLLSLDLQKWVMLNPETVGYLSYKCAGINYPVVQTKDNDYYLTHDIKKENNKAGWVFGDYRDDFDSLGDSTVIYAHNRRDGSMFAHLNSLSNDSLMVKKNRVVLLQTINNSFAFEIFSVFDTSVDFQFNKTKFESDIEKSKYLKRVQGLCIFSSLQNVQVNTNDKLLILSTCSNGFDNKRRVACAKLIDSAVEQQ